MRLDVTGLCVGLLAMIGLVGTAHADSYNDQMQRAESRCQDAASRHYEIIRVNGVRQIDKHKIEVQLRVRKKKDKLDGLCIYDGRKDKAKFNIVDNNYNGGGNGGNNGYIPPFGPGPVKPPKPPKPGYGTKNAEKACINAGNVRGYQSQVIGRETDGSGNVVLMLQTTNNKQRKGTAQCTYNVYNGKTSTRRQGN